MSELERARKYLRHQQETLRYWRMTNRVHEDAENAVLAALSWVWEEQERERYRGCEMMCPCEAELHLSRRPGAWP